MSDLQTLDRNAFASTAPNEQTVLGDVSYLFNQGVSRYIDLEVKVERRKIDEFLEELGMFGLTHGVAANQISEVQKTIEDLAEEKRFRNVKVLVTDKPYQPEGDATVVVFDGIKQYAGKGDQIGRFATINGTQMYKANMPDFEDIPHMGKKKIMVLVFEKNGQTTLDGAEVDAVMGAMMEAGGGSAAAVAELEEINAAIDAGDATPEILDIIEAVAEIAALEKIAQEPGAPEDIQAQIDTLKNNLVEMLQSPEVASAAPQALIEAAQAVITVQEPAAPVLAATQDVPVQQVESVLAQVEALLSAEGVPQEVVQILSETIENIHTSLDGGDIEAVAIQLADMKVQLSEMVPMEALPPQILAKIIDVLPAISSVQAQVVSVVEAAQAAPLQRETTAPKLDVAQADIAAVVEALGNAKIDPAQIEAIKAELQSGEISKATLEILERAAPDLPAAVTIAQASILASVIEQGTPTAVDFSQPEAKSIVDALEKSGLDKVQVEAIKAELQSGEISKATLEILERAAPDLPVTAAIMQASVVAAVLEQGTPTAVEFSQPEATAIVEALEKSGLDKAQVEAIKAELTSGEISPSTLEVITRTMPAAEVTKVMLETARDTVRDAEPIPREVAQVISTIIKNDTSIPEAQKAEIIKALEGKGPEALKVLANANPALAETIVRQQAEMRVAEKATVLADRLESNPVVKNDPVVREALEQLKDGRVPPPEILAHLKEKLPELRNEVTTLERRNDDRIANLPRDEVRRDMQDVAQKLRDNGHPIVAKEIERFMQKNPEASPQQVREYISQKPKDFQEKLYAANSEVQQEKQPVVVLKNADPTPVLRALETAMFSMPANLAHDVQMIKEQIAQGKPIDLETMGRVFEKMPEKERQIISEALKVEKQGSALKTICENCPHGGRCDICNNIFAGVTGESMAEERARLAANPDGLQNDFGSAKATAIKGNFVAANDDASRKLKNAPGLHSR